MVSWPLHGESAVPLFNRTAARAGVAKMDPPDHSAVNLKLELERGGAHVNTQRNFKQSARFLNSSNSVMLAGKAFLARRQPVMMSRSFVVHV